MTTNSGMSKQVWSGTLKSLAVGISVFYLGRELAVWLTVHNVHGFLAFVDNVVAGIAAAIVVLIYERRRQRAVDTLRESEQRFRLVADTAPALIWMSGTDKLCTYFNKPWLDFTGRSMEEELGNGWTEGVHPDDLQRCLQTYTHSFDRRDRFRMEYRLRQHDGEYRWILDIGVPRFNQDRSFAGYIGIGVDVTDRRRTEEALRGSEERLHLAAQAGKMYPYEWDVATDKVVRSEECVNVLGYSNREKQLTRQQLLASIHPEDRALFVGSVDHLTPQYPTTQISYRVSRPDGSVVWLEKNARGFFDEQGKLLRVIGMVANITERKRAEEALQESEERFRLVANTAPVMIWMSGLDKKPTYFNQLWLDFTGLSETDLQNGLAGIVHPEDYQQCRDVYSRGFDQRQPFKKECRLRRHDGQYRWMLDIGVPRFHKDGSFAGYIGSCIDVTDHKLAEEALSSVSRRLIEAQEQERTRIARELHDDIGQRLALLAIELEQLHQNSADLPPEVRSHASKLWKQTSDIASDVQSLSHELHSSKLEYLGIVAAMRGLCKEFGEQQKVEIDFQTRDLPPNPLPPDISLCLFRVLQEALHNSAKHSGVPHFEVRLWGTSDEIHLTVKDSGVGFDSEAAMTSRGLGLISMEERLKLVKGTLSIDSQPKRGTTIHARVPFNAISDSARAAG